jgi:hypothetical protein
LRRAPFLGLAVWIAGFTALYAPVAGGLARDWAADANYSHGFLVVPLAGYLMWARRARIASAPIVPSWWGLGVVAASVVVFLAGTLGAELFLTRISMVGVVAGSVLLVAGWRVLRATAVPVAFLLLMVPPPAIVFNAVAMPLQLWASQAGERYCGCGGCRSFARAMCSCCRTSRYRSPKRAAAFAPWPR